MKKKLLALLLITSMSASALTACGGGKTDENKNSGTSGETAGGTETGGSTGEVSGSGAGEYTYRSVTSMITTWNPTDWTIESEMNIIGYTTSPLYNFVMNEAKDGHDIVCDLAAQMPVDVTADYAGNETYGVPEGAGEGYAWKVAMRQDAQWEDGTPISVKDVEYTIQQFLNPEMKNYRASTFYSGKFGLANAYGYYQNDLAGGTKYSLADDLGLAMADLSPAEDGQYVNADGNKAYFSWSVPVNSDWMDGASVADYTDYMTEETASGLEALANEDGYIPVTADSYALLHSFTGSDSWGNESEEDLIHYTFCEDGIVEETPWENVGFVKDDDYTFTIVLSNPCTDFEFKYNSSYIYIIKEDLYEANKQDTGGVVKSSYGTTADKYISYGPYKVASYQPDKLIRLEKNENWYGYQDGTHEGEYQTTAIELQWIDELTTQLSMFLQGNLDDYGLTSDDMEKYGTSDYCYFMPETFTYYLTLNTDFDILKTRETSGINKTIFTYLDFRKAFSLAIDRNDYVKSCTASSQAAYGLINPVYICDPDTGLAYRDSKYAQQALCDVYGVSSVSEITGYDKEAAAALFQSAYDQCLADGNISDGDTVEIEYHVYGSEARYQKMVDFVQNAMNEATVGTSLENRISVVLVEDQDLYTTMKSGQDDMILGSWGGSDMDPYNMMQCYTDPAYITEFGFDSSQPLTISVQGKEITKSFFDWYLELYEGAYATAELDVRNEILAGIEKGLLLNYHIAPMYALTSGSLYSHRIVLGSEEYINSLVQFGGLQYMTYTMDDAEWAAYCAEQGNNLSY